MLKKHIFKPKNNMKDIIYTKKFKLLYLEHTVDRGAWWARVHVVIKSQT